jgi:hypothetical protein
MEGSMTLGEICVYGAMVRRSSVAFIRDREPMKGFDQRLVMETMS